MTKQIFKNSEKLIKEISNNDATYISALAGSGKTTLLKEISFYNSDKKIIYLALNDSIIKEAKTILPKNVTCKTFHSLSYEIIGKNYKKRIKNNFNRTQIINFLFLNRYKDYNYIAKEIIKCLNEYCYSEFFKINDFINNYNPKFSTKEFLKKNCSILWEKFINPDSDFDITHDVYLKIFQLQNNGSPLIDYDLILLDEAQDTNNCIKKIILEQYYFHGKKIIFVGDKYQYIYGFRGSVNIFDDIQYHKKFKKIELNKTYRFGKEIEKITNKVLYILNSDQYIIGNKKINSSINNVDKNNIYTILNRTNNGLIGNLLKYGKSKKIMIISKKEINFNLIIDFYNFKNNPSLVKNYFLNSFFSFENFKKIAYENNDLENITLIKMIDNINNDIIENIQIVKNNIVYNEKEADIILSTVHNVKGLEFEQVVLANDFYDPFDIKNKLKTNLNLEEINILYTAITRAKLRLNLNLVADKINKLVEING